MGTALPAVPEAASSGHTSPEMGVQMYRETGHYARPPRNNFSGKKRLSIDRLTAVRTRRNQRNGNRKFTLKKLDVRLQSLRQRLSLYLLSRPAVHLLIYRRNLFIHQLIRKYISLTTIAKLVSRTHFHTRKNTQHIGLHHQQLCDAVDHDRILQRRKINPSTTTRSPRRRSKLIALLAHQLSLFIQQLRRERTASNPRAVRLEDSKHLSDMTRRNAKTGTRASRNRVRTGDKRITTKVDVKQRTLRPFRQDRRSFAKLLVQEVLALNELERAKEIDRLHKRLLQFVPVELHVVIPQDLKVHFGQLFKTFPEVVRQNIPHAQSLSANLVLVGRTNTLQRRTNLVFSLRSFVGMIQ